MNIENFESTALSAALLASDKSKNPNQQPVVQVVLNFPPIVSYDGLSLLMGRTVQTLQADRCRNPESVPPASTPPGSRIPLWDVGQILLWLQQHRGRARERKTPKRVLGRGASTKVERLAAQEAGLTVRDWRAMQIKGEVKTS